LTFLKNSLIIMENLRWEKVGLLLLCILCAKYCSLVPIMVLHFVGISRIVILVHNIFFLGDYCVITFFEFLKLMVLMSFVACWMCTLWRHNNECAEKWCVIDPLESSHNRLLCLDWLYSAHRFVDRDWQMTRSSQQWGQV